LPERVDLLDLPVQGVVNERRLVAVGIPARSYV
jgi:hypothetical protein